MNSELFVSVEWKIGDVILDLYEVRDIHLGGGMGLVYRVHHKNWKTDLAVKCPRAKYFETEQQKENFTNECEAWIDLGLHQHIVSCYYVRILGGVPRVFAESVEGGTLKDWIKDERLYDGGAEVALKRILDVAIQMAWGLDYAHEKGMIHQDVKPGNVMMTPDGVAKITDFGLVKARQATGEKYQTGIERSLLLSMGGMTPAYCSPEQANKEKLSRRTDLWSWAASVLEMFTGGVTWLAGQAANEALESYLDSGTENIVSVKMPKEVARLLQKCFRRNPKDRPPNMQSVVEELRQIYQGVTGENYERPEPSSVDLSADSLNNRGVSLLDLGRTNDALAAWDAALAQHPGHFEATYNQQIQLWNMARVTDQEIVQALREAMQQKNDDWSAAYHLGLVHLARKDGDAAIEMLKEAARIGEGNDVFRVLNSADAQNYIDVEELFWFDESGHGAAHSSAVTPDFDLLVASDDDYNFHLWDIGDQQLLRSFEGHTAAINCLAFSSDKKCVLSGSEDKTLRLWDVETGSCITLFKGHEAPINDACIDNEQTMVLSCSSDKSLRLWNVITGSCTKIFEGHAECVNTVHFVNNDRFALSSSDDHTLRLWDLKSGLCVMCYEGHTKAVKSASVSSDESWALSSSEDKTIRLWDINTGLCIRVFRGHNSGVKDVALSHNKRWAITTGIDSSVRIWDVATAKCVRTIALKGCQWVYFRNYDSLALAVTDEECFKIAGIDSLCGTVNDLLSSTLLSVARSTNEYADVDSSFLYLSTMLNESLRSENNARSLELLQKARSLRGYEFKPELLSLWNECGLKAYRTGFKAAHCIYKFINAKETPMPPLCVGLDNSFALTGSEDGYLLLWNLGINHSVRRFMGETGGITAICLSSDGRLAVTGSRDKFLRVWDLREGRCSKKYAGHTGNIISVYMSSDGCWILSGGDDDCISIWETSTGRLLYTFDKKQIMMQSLCLSADDGYVLSGGVYDLFDQYLRFWEVSSGECVGRYKGLEIGRNSIRLIANCHFALMGGLDSNLYYVDLNANGLRRAMTGHSSSISSVCLSLDDRWALSGSSDATFRLWDVQAGQCLRIFEDHADSVTSVCLSNDLRWALSGSVDGRVRLWELDWEFEARDPVDWDERARRYLEIFLTQHTPYATKLPPDGELSEEQVRLALTRRGKPIWSEDDFSRFMHHLACCGYGWLRPEGVRRELERMASERD